MTRPAQNALEIGAALRDARAAKGWTQAHLAEAAGVSRQLVVGVERGKRPGTELSRVLSIARALGLGVALTPLPAGDRTPMDAALDAIIGGDE
ncbi:helix-turn-helix transcriptional regulator [Actinotalea subterranea]|uniref:helix-turn-helix transcriptional regulator n=1 Tax=Actinotalea subterranea TaxID=2607497 RepID=UPI001FE7DCB1|nr:helix-turn-helix domain-containing protein [Actinotalea subterranea]